MQLQGLVRKELIRPTSSEAADDEYRFGHILVRDAAYAGLPKDARADLHERVARLLEERFAGGFEVDELAGYHLEQASRCLREFDPLDARVADLAARAAVHLSAAGRRAAMRGDSNAATSLLERTLALMAPDEPDRGQLLIDLADTLRLSGNLDGADARLVEAVEWAARVGRPEVGRRAELDRALLLWVTNPGDGTERVLREVEAAIVLFQERGDHVALAHAWAIATQIYWIRCEIGRMQRAIESGIAAAAAGGLKPSSRIRNALARAAAYGPTPVGEGLRLCGELGAGTEGDRSLEAMINLYTAFFEALEGRFDDARARAAAVGPVLDELGRRGLMAAQRTYASRIELLAGDPVAAERFAREGDEIFQSLGDRGNRPGVIVYLAAALAAQGREEEAEAILAEAEQLASPDDAEAQIRLRTVRARIRAAAGALEEAEELAREALARADRTDAFNLRGESLLTLAEILERAGDREEAHALAADALALYEAKGDVVGAQAARSLLGAEQLSAR
jgi:tetratricopeptide (TPR) repeat protein